ncbi:MAG: glycosyltransferase family 2 protein [Thermodesulfobacteriota bacterium]
MISIVIPAFNEEKAIGQTVRMVREALDPNQYPDTEILVVDDGSSDRTSELAQAAGARVHRHPQNAGYGRTLKEGIRLARHETIVILDADLSYPAQTIPVLLEEYGRGFDMVVGARTGHHFRGSMFKGPLRWILKLLVEYAAGRPVPDANSGLRVFSKSRVEEYLNHLCDTFSFTTSLTLAYLMTGRFVCFLPIEYYERVGRTKVRLLKDSLRTLRYILQAIIYYNPLKIFILMSAACVLFSTFSFIIGAITHINAPYYLGIGGLLVTLLVFSLGLLAELLRQIMVK